MVEPPAGVPLVDGPGMTGRDHAVILAVVDVARRDWHRVAALLEEVGSVDRLLRGEWTGLETYDVAEVKSLMARVTEESIARFEVVLEQVAARGIRFTTVLDEGYPLNLRYIHNRPPFLFIRGELEAGDSRAVAVVGTRTPSAEGRETARRLSAELAGRGVTVLSGLARGIDTAAHEGALAAGGRTIAVMGTGISAPVYPAENAPLAERIVTHGALVSQFRPDAPPSRWSFPMRNVVMSGMAVGTVVVEASSTGGARMQARIALEHGKRLLLVDSLVSQQPWARRYASHPATRIVRSIDDILDVLVSVTAPVQQLSLA
jgi:DNA processing protein